MGPRIINIDEDIGEGDVVGPKRRQQIKVFAMFSVALFMVSFAHVMQARGDGAIGAGLGLTAVALSLAMVLEAQHS